MLETHERWAESLRECGYQTGLQGSQTEFFIRSLRWFYKNREDPDLKEREIAYKLLNLVEQSIRPNQMEELEDFVKAYPKMPVEKLATRIMQQSEYVYG